MMDNPLVSIIIPCYNSELFIAEAVESILNQDYRNFELIIIDDCSTDNSVQIINKYAESDNRIRLIKLEQNKGVANARNIGFENVKGDLISSLDSDDIWLPGKLSFQVEYMKSNNCDIFTCGFYKMDINSKILSHIKLPKYVTYSSLLYSNCLSNSTVIMKKDIKQFRYKKIGHEDYVFWLEVLKAGYTVHTDSKPVSCYRIRQDSVSGNKLKASKFQWNIYRNYLKFGVIKSAYYFVFYTIKGLMKFLK